MTDPSNLRADQLREALAQIGGAAGKSWAGDHYLVREEVIAAARSFLAVLEGPTDEMVEAGAQALHDQAVPEFDVEEIPWSECHELYQMDRRIAARTVLQAALAQIWEPRNLDLAAQTPLSPPKLGEPLQEDTE